MNQGSCTSAWAPAGSSESASNWPERPAPHCPRAMHSQTSNSRPRCRNGWANGHEIVARAPKTPAERQRMSSESTSPHTSANDRRYAYRIGQTPGPLSFGTSSESMIPWNCVDCFFRLMSARRGRSGSWTREQMAGLARIDLATSPFTVRFKGTNWRASASLWHPELRRWQLRKVPDATNGASCRTFCRTECGK